LDKQFSEEEGILQRGGKLQISYEKPILYYQNLPFPFKDKEFDYVISSHVLEHIKIDEVDLFIKELERIAKKGYIECPKFTYEYLFNFKVHTTLINYKNGEMLILPKDKVVFTPIQDMFYELFKEGFAIKPQRLIEDFIDFFMFGFEWDQKIPYKIVDSIDMLVDNDDLLRLKEYFAKLKILESSKPKDSLLKKVFKKIFRR